MVVKRVDFVLQVEIENSKNATEPRLSRRFHSACAEYGRK